MTITVDQLKALFPSNKNLAELCTALNTHLPKYGIGSKNEICAYLAQCGHESLGFTVLQENLNYSADGLKKTFPKYFTEANAATYERQPVKIANKIYASRMGNGPESSGDGWCYHGRGAIQLTGKDNYVAFAASIGKPLNDTVAYCGTLEGAIESSVWYWQKNKLDNYDDKETDFITLTKHINGGTIGLQDRLDIYHKALEVIV